jgi:hypothetical protein
MYSNGCLFLLIWVYARLLLLPRARVYNNYTYMRTRTTMWAPRGMQTAQRLVYTHELAPCMHTIDPPRPVVHRTRTAPPPARPDAWSSQSLAPGHVSLLRYDRASRAFQLINVAD